MNDNDWQSLHFFKKEEAWGNPDLMSLSLLKTLDTFRSYLNSPIIINFGTQGVHAQKSHHYEGFAVDCVIPSIKLADGLLEAFRFPFTGIGIYPDWHHEGKKVGGFHLEVVPSELNSPKKTWIGLDGPDNQPCYVALNFTNLKEWCNDNL